MIPLRSAGAAALAATLLLFVAAAPGAAAQEPPAEEPAEPAPAPAPAPGLSEAAEEERAEPEPEEAAEEEAEVPPEEGDTVAVEPPPPAENITFDIPLPEEDGGGRVTGSAGFVSYERENVVRLTGGVDLRHRDMRLQAQRMNVDLQTQEVMAEGEVILDQGPRRLVGATLNFNLDTRTGELSDATAYVDPDFYFSGETIAKTGEDTYVLTRGSFTSCTDPTPDWSFRVSRAKVRVEGFARGTNVRMKVKKLPVLYAPYLAVPAKSERTSGFLLPNIGYSDRLGEYLGLAYFQTLGRSYDTTFYADLYGEEYYALGNELRYVPSEFTRGELEAYVIDDPVSEDLRWKVQWNHVADRLPWGLRGVVNYYDFSDFDFFRDFERDLNDITLRSVYGSAYVSKSVGSQSFNLLVDDRETFISNRTIVQRQLPELEYRLRPTQLFGLPVYLELLGAFHYLDTQRSESLDSTYERLDVNPTFTVPFLSAPWLSATVSAGGRATYYGDSLTEAGNAFSGESLSRVFPSGGVQVVGPSFSRIFETPLGSFGKFKHIIEPRWSYSYVDEFDDQDLVPLFDEVDRVRPTNIGSFSLVNRVLAKPRDVFSGAETREILTFELTQFYSFDDTRPLELSSDREQSSQRGPIQSRLRFNPSERLSVDASVTYSTLFDAIAATSLSAGYNWSYNSAGVTWFTREDVERDITRSNQVRLFTSLGLWPGRLRLDAQLNYDFERGEFQQHRYEFNYSSDCWGMRLELREFNLGNRDERDYRFAVSLKNIGTFLDLTGGQRSGRLR